MSLEIGEGEQAQRDVKVCPDGRKHKRSSKGMVLEGRNTLVEEWSVLQRTEWATQKWAQCTMGWDNLFITVDSDGEE